MRYIYDEAILLLMRQRILDVRNYLADRSSWPFLGFSRLVDDLDEVLDIFDVAVNEIRKHK